MKRSRKVPARTAGTKFRAHLDVLRVAKDAPTFDSYPYGIVVGTRTGPPRARHLRVDHARRFSRGKVHVNGLAGFWAYAKGKLLKHHGVSPAKFPLYLYESQFRYNHRRGDLFHLLITASLQLVPDL